MSRVKSWYRFLSPKFRSLPLDYAVDFKPRYGHDHGPAHQQLNVIIDGHRDSYKRLLEKSLSYSDQIQAIPKLEDISDPAEPGWNNEYLPGLDMVALYTMLAEHKPQKYVEIGSGNSTKVAYKAKKDNDLRTHIVSIDPHPRAEIDQLADEVIRKRFEDIDHQSLLDLKSGDILFVDNSHRILPNSDSMVFFMEILPRLAKGVIVHIHDVYLPYDYPQFMCDRFYSEQYGLAFYLLANPERYRTIFPCFFVSEDSELAQIIAPMWEHPNLEGVEKHGGSFWLQVC